MFYWGRLSVKVMFLDGFCAPEMKSVLFRKQCNFLKGVQFWINGFCLCPRKQSVVQFTRRDFQESLRLYSIKIHLQTRNYKIAILILNCALIALS